ncbi:vitamin K epoxide reductase family protein [Cryobacterium sp. TMT1-21]|uniref:Vitamin K epoxide reductase family protein n=1 Tax=Cryobacterium shii TaxID=1259235 RepID=A0AAQ2C534_9MICO|nr:MULTISPECIES: vitamin K epoxide reductase family protein [Cryobacterium]TFC43618.1 vitamin K epoxide reductase family protein [Cryobacterium shii]TFD15904.1 vitamin K epoxide reductase family protein [Cryobacterium sp. TMT1-21]TFD19752.1 vitamin K epoxide reductase family protein [Cryobacterium sp. TMT2-23]TFD39849.1 vitamin K epoxide reductase family protein [Cryobacterium sp. TMT2-10]
MPAADQSKRPVGLAIFLIVGGLIALTAAFLLTIDKFRILEDPQAQLSCNFSVLVGCSTNLGSWQGAIFGFPNPLIGLIAWTVVITIGVAILAGARFKRWFWIGLNIGVTGALALVIWLMGQSFFVLDVLCPWCMVTWVVTIPTFLAVTLHNLTVGNLPASPGVRRFAAGAYSWIVVITIGCYLVAAVIAQLQMDFLHRL